ncbi:UNC93-like protein MFSD11-like [Nesidiocoris tenuis]|uniref:UNC93-like protein MFSD11 n=1 Tax=Nesidiocoris tenuis TaxID=355587 RepID=A0ABN7A8P5_9HEMI|nr:UNC93-like protein MFSD11-like [Nesidiocoris tenuis]
MLVFSADNARSNVMKLLNHSITEDDPSYSVDGYVALGMTYVIYAISLLFAPTVVNLIGPRGAMTLGSTMMTVFLCLLLLENTWFTYFGICLTGCGGSLVWVGQGNYVVRNSEPEKHRTHVSLFWAVFTISTILGNVYAAVAFVGKERLDAGTRWNLLTVMIGFGVVSVLAFATLRPPVRKTPVDKADETAYEAFKKTLAIYMSREFLTLLITFCFIGFQQSFGWGVHSSCVGFTRGFGSFSTELAPITSVAYGIGGTLGGGVHAVAPYLQLNWTRRYAFGMGYILQLFGLLGIFLNLPNSSVFGYTDESPFLGTPIVWLACVCSFMMGIGDSFYNTQLYPLLAFLHPEYSAHTAALYKFTKSMAMAAFYFASITVGLHAQVIIMVLTGFFAVLCFSAVDVKVYKRCESRQNKI